MNSRTHEIWRFEFLKIKKFFEQEIFKKKDLESLIRDTYVVFFARQQKNKNRFAQLLSSVKIHFWSASEHHPMHLYDEGYTIFENFPKYDVTASAGTGLMGCNGWSRYRTF